MATGFQTSLQDTINWLTQAEQTLNMAQPPSLMLDTVLFQIDEHKVATLKMLMLDRLLFRSCWFLDIVINMLFALRVTLSTLCVCPGLCQ